jgi:hypothetical protein
MKITVTRLKEIIKEEVSSFVSQEQPIEEAGAIDMQALKQKLTILAQAPTRGLGRLQQADLQTFMQAIDTAVTVLSKV